MGGAEGEHDSLIVLVCGRKVLQLKLRMAGLNCGHVGIQIVGIPLTGGAVVGVSSGSYSKIGGTVPVAAVVTGVITGFAEVGYFIVLKAGITEMGAHAVIHLGAGVVIGRGYEALDAHTFQGRALLVREAVG